MRWECLSCRTEDRQSLGNQMGCIRSPFARSSPAKNTHIGLELELLDVENLGPIDFL